MDIHHAMMVHNKPDKLYEAITQQSDLEVWMGAHTLAKPEVGSIIEFQYDQGQCTLKMEVTRLETGKQVQWRVIQPGLAGGAAAPSVHWPVVPSQNSTPVDLRWETTRTDSQI